MALVRCDRCGVRPAGNGTFTRSYVRSVLPPNHPESGLICGRPACSRPGLIWLEASEANDYARGQRAFALQTHTTKVRAA